MKELLRIDQITVDQSINIRDIDIVLVAEYGEAMEREDHFPAIRVVDDGKTKWLYAGFHRIQAAQETGLEHFEAEIRDGTRRDAEYLACTENATHGVPRTREQKWEAVGRALRLKPDKSGREIARDLKVGNRFVEKVRKSLTVSGHSENQERTYTTKHGTVATMKTDNIGTAIAKSENQNQLAEIVSVDDLIDNNYSKAADIDLDQVNTVDDFVKQAMKAPNLVNDWNQLYLTLLRFYNQFQEVKTEWDIPELGSDFATLVVTMFDTESKWSEFSQAVNMLGETFDQFNNIRYQIDNLLILPRPGRTN